MGVVKSSVLKATQVGGIILSEQKCGFRQLGLYRSFLGRFVQLNLDCVNHLGSVDNTMTGFFDLVVGAGFGGGRRPAVVLVGIVGRFFTALSAAVGSLFAIGQFLCTLPMFFGAVATVDQSSVTALLVRGANTFKWSDSFIQNSLIFEINSDVGCFTEFADEFAVGQAFYMLRFSSVGGMGEIERAGASLLVNKLITPSFLPASLMVGSDETHLLVVGASYLLTVTSTVLGSTSETSLVNFISTCLSTALAEFGGYQFIGVGRVELA